MKIHQILGENSHQKELEFYTQLEKALLTNKFKYGGFYRDASSAVQDLFDVKWDGSGFIVEADETCQDILKVLTPLKNIEESFPCWLEVKEFIGGIEFVGSISLYDDASKMIPEKVTGLTLKACSLNVNTIKKLDVEYGLELSGVNINGVFMNTPVIDAGNFMINNDIGSFGYSVANASLYEPFSAFSKRIIDSINNITPSLTWNEDYMSASPDDLLTAIKIGIKPVSMKYEGVNKRRAVDLLRQYVDYSANVRQRVMKATQLLTDDNLEVYLK